MKWKSLDRFALGPELQSYKHAVGGAGQLIPLIATIHGIKPVMDDWVPVPQLPRFRELCRGWGLHCEADSAVEFIGRQVPNNIIGRNTLNTTRAFGSAIENAIDTDRAHVFVGRDPSEVEQAMRAGWYPLVTNRHRVIEKPWIDHYYYGESLGYPVCCRDAFSRCSDWWTDNTLFQASRNTTTNDYLCNPLLKYTGYGFVSWLPCAFDCSSTRTYSAAVRAALFGLVPDLAAYADSLLRGVYLVLSEWEILRLEGVRHSAERVDYRDVLLVPTDRPDRELYQRVRQGNRIVLREDLILVQRDDKVVSVIRTNVERFGPQIPMLIEFV